MAIIEFIIHVDDPDEIVALYDRIQVWRSSTELGTYFDITSNEETSAVLDGSVAGPWNLNGQVLNVVLNGADVKVVNFAGTNPISLSSVISQINAVLEELALEVPTDTGQIRLLSAVSGTQSSIQVTGTAAATLGLSTTKVNGKAARPLISENTEDYTFRDYDGDNSFWYKTRYFGNITEAVSEFSISRKGGDGVALGSSFLVIGKVALANASGEPIVGRRVIIVPSATAQVIDDGGGNNYGVLPSVERITFMTDNNGRAQITLVKGQRLKVFLEGTTFQREFVVPNTDFDILTVASAQPDPLSIVVAPPIPIRM